MYKCSENVANQKSLKAINLSIVYLSTYIHTYLSIMLTVCEPYLHYLM